MASRIVASSLLRQAVRPAFVRPRLRAVGRLPSPILPQTLLLARLMSDETRSMIDKAVATAPVVLFMKGIPEMPQCGFSQAVIRILGMQGMDPQKFSAFNVLEDQTLREAIKEYSDWPTIPQLYVEKEFIGGADIVLKMYETGELGKMFADKGLLASGYESQ
ncbi:hypothetical protein CP533_6092 [Ophiocordyceps camponoti-saundersi (nom. inval.)]|nr:hypothetical protein CP533_6092 [Ophiocordyceps camponoti-saundersi (nom. inval.)]